jgi:nicotinamide mononucleotide transporter
LQKPIKYFELFLVLAVSITVGVACKLYWPDSSGWPEVWAFVFGAVAVYFQTVEHILTWPTWIVCVLIYSYVFYQGRLFADAILQIFYFVLSIHGWMLWRRGEVQNDLPVTRMKPIGWIPFFAIILIGTAIYTPILKHFNGAAPFIDALLSISSVVTQYLLNRKIYENWMMWVLINGAYIPLYLSRGYKATAILYAVYWILAVLGWISWRKSLTANAAAT